MTGNDRVSSTTSSWFLHARVFLKSLTDGMRRRTVGILLILLSVTSPILSAKKMVIR